MPDNFFQNQTPPPFYGNSVEVVDETTKSLEKSLFTKVFAWMGGALLVTALTALVVVNTSLGMAIVGSQPLFLGLIIAELVVVFVLSARINRMSFATAATMMILYSILNGATLSIIFLAYTASSVARVFIITAAMFGAMALYGALTKRNFAPVYRYLMMALIGLIVMVVVNLFLRSSAFDWIISSIGVVLFTVLTAVDTNRIKLVLKQQLNEGSDMVSLHKVALLGALTLYLDFINLFLYLLRFLGNRN